MLRLALPSNNRLANDTMSMLNACGIHVSRRGTGLVEEVRDIPECEAVFLRPDDIPAIIAEGGAHLGITGRDWFEEKSLPAWRTCRASSRIWGSDTVGSCWPRQAAGLAIPVIFRSGI